MLANSAQQNSIGPQQQRRPRGDAILVFAFFLCAFWLTNCGFDTSESIFHYRVAQQLVAKGQLGFDQPVEGVFTTAPNGQTYGSHEFGNTLLLIPSAAVNRGLVLLAPRLGASADRIGQLCQFIVVFQAGLYASLTLTLLYLFLTREYGQTVREGFLGCIAFGFGTFFWDYSRSLYDGVLCGLLLVAALYALLRYRATGRLIPVWLGFSLLGLAVDTRLSMIVPTLVALGFVVAVRPSPRLKTLVVAGIALAPFAAWQLWYNNLRTGSPLFSPVQTPQYAVNNALDGDLMDGLIGLLVSPGKGLFIYVPFLFISAIAFPRFWRRDRAVAMFVLGSGTLWLLLHAKLRSWYGAWGWGPRHMITIVPILVLPGLVQLPVIWSRAAGRVVVSAVVLAGFVLAGAAIVGNYHYRLELANREGRLGDETFVWGWRNQPLDMLTGTCRNLSVVAGVARPVMIPEASDLNNYASNRINVWWYTLPRAGIPWPAVAVACAPLVFGMIWSGRRLFKGSAA